MSEPVADLDDFFAKKDRKKSKKKFPSNPTEFKETTTSVAAAKKLETTSPLASQDNKDEEVVA